MKLKTTRFDPIEDDDGWLISRDRSDDFEPIENKALALQAEAKAKGFYCICSSVEDEGYAMYLVPPKGIRYVIEKFFVGSHAGAEPDSVYAEISEADAKNPLVPYFADEAGLKARFSKPVTEALVKILEDSLYSIEAMADEDEGSIEGYIRKNKGIHLWWD